MKIPVARVEPFLARPEDSLQAVLLYGPDEGLVRERAAALAQRVAGNLADPFRYLELPAATIAADPARLSDEAASLSLTGGKRAVRIREGGDSLVPALENMLAGKPSGVVLIIIEAGELPPRSALRKMFENEPSLAACACYGDEGAGLLSFISKTLQAEGVSASRDVMAYLADSLGADRQITRSELQKLALYVADKPDKSLSLEEAKACVADGVLSTLEDIVYSMAGGSLGQLDKALQRAFSEGASAIEVLRAANNHFQRLYQADIAVTQGASREQAMASLQPPVFYKLKDAFSAQLRYWPFQRSGRILSLLLEAEIACKSSAVPAEAFCRRTLLSIAAGAAKGKAA